MKTLCIITILFLFISCNEKNELLPKEVTNPTNVYQKNGMLVFPNTNTALEFLNQPSSYKNPTPLNFLSQNDLFEEVIQAETIFWENRGNNKNNELHSDLYKQYLKEGIIHEVKYSDGSQSYDLNLCEPQYAKILNKEGFFAIGDTIYQITENSLKVWINGDFSNYNYLKSVNETDKTHQIFVNTNMPCTRTLPANTLDQCKGAYMSKGNDRYLILFQDQTNLVFSSMTYSRATYVRVIGQTKTSGNNYNYKSFSFYWWVNFTVNKNGVEDFWSVANQYAGSNMWYTIAMDYKVQTSGKQDPLVADPSTAYQYIDHYTLCLEPQIGSAYIRLLLTCQREDVFAGKFLYRVRGEDSTITTDPIVVIIDEPEDYFK